jgi:glycosyltransferase involved in cell wall biosynthesis
MKINVFSYVYWPEFFLVNELTESLALHGHQVSVQTSLPNYQRGSLAPHYGYLKGPYFEKHREVSIFRYPVIPRKKSFIFLALNYLSNIVVSFFNLVRLPKADLYFFFATSPLLLILPVVLLKKITRKPLVIWYQDLWPDSFFAVTGFKSDGVFAAILKPFIKFIYKNTDLMLLQSPAFKTNLEKFNYQGRIEVLYNWAPEGVVKEEDPEWLNDLPSNKFILTFAGNIGKVQAVDHIIEAAHRLQSEAPSVHIAIVGDGSFLPDAKVRAQQLALNNIRFYGRKPVEDMPNLFQKSDALLVSLKNDPTFNNVVPSKVQAYMSSGKPIVAFLNGIGAETIAKAHCGVVAEAENQACLKRHVKSWEKTGKTFLTKIFLKLNHSKN